MHSQCGYANTQDPQAHMPRPNAYMQIHEVPKSTCIPNIATCIFDMTRNVYRKRNLEFLQTAKCRTTENLLYETVI